MPLPARRPAPPQAALHYLRRRRVVAAGMAMVSRPGAGQTTWPRQPIRMVVGFPPGGGLDLAARLLARSLADALGQPVQVENRTGANGALATESAARAADGHTLLFANTGAAAINNVLFPSLTVDALRDLTPVAMIVETPFFFALSRHLPVTTLAEFVALARAQPGRLSFGSPGIGSVHHLSFERFRRALGLEILHVPYRGTAMALQDMAAGRLDFTMDTYVTTRGAEQAGYARIVAVAAAGRVDWREDLPTVAEAAGLPGYEIQSWMVLMAPATTPPAVLATLEGVVERALREGALAEALRREHLPPRFRGSAATRAFIESERAAYASVIREAGIRLDGG